VTRPKTSLAPPKKENFSSKKQPVGSIIHASRGNAKRPSNIQSEHKPTRTRISDGIQRIINANIQSKFPPNHSRAETEVSHEEREAVGRIEMHHKLSYQPVCTEITEDPILKKSSTKKQKTSIVQRASTSISQNYHLSSSKRNTIHGLTEPSLLLSKQISKTSAKVTST
jgi:hypothetical protein